MNQMVARGIEKDTTIYLTDLIKIKKDIFRRETKKITKERHKLWSFR